MGSQKFVPILCLFIIYPMLNSCMHNWEAEQNLLFAIGTIKVIEKQDYYIDLDEGSKLYPSDTTSIQNYQIIPGQRVFVYFTPLTEVISGYDYNAKIMQIENILTKDIYLMPSEKSDSIGNDPVNIVETWISKGYLNIKYQFYCSNNPKKKHMLNLVVNNEMLSENTTSNNLLLEFRHNAYNDSVLVPQAGIVSFKLDNISNYLNNKKHINIMVKSLYDGIVYIPINIISSTGSIK